MAKRLSPIILFVVCLLSCSREQDDPVITEYRQQMRDFVIGISRDARSRDTDFIVIPQNGIDLITENGNADGKIATGYLDAINGAGQEELFYGYDNEDNIPTPSDVTEHMQAMLSLARNSGKTILVTDYCSDPGKINDSYARNSQLGFTDFVAIHRDLDHIPQSPEPVEGINTQDVTRLSQVKNFLYLINTQNYPTKTAFLNAVKSTSYDLVIMDLYAQDGEMMSPADLESIRVKSGGGSRLLICYLSIGEAEDYRYYWDPAWTQNKPDWLGPENPDWPGNYQVKYWAPSWQQYIFGHPDAYLEKIMNAGFDGVYLDRIDAFEDFE